MHTVSTPTVPMPQTRSRALGLKVAALCLAFGVLETAQGYVGSLLRDDPHALRQAILFSGVPWLPAALLAPIVVMLAERWPLDHGRWQATLPRHLVAMLGFIIVHEAAVVLLLPALGAIPLGWILVIKEATFRSALDGVVYWAVVGATHAVRSSREASERAQATARLEAGLADARLAALRAQLDPHFLFNTLNAVSALALRGEREGVVRALATLSDLLRETLGGAPTQEIALADEMALLDRYLEIQLLRFSDRLEVVRDMDAAALDAAVPAMLLQPLVENAVQHAVAARPGPMRIEIRARRMGESVRIEVRDSGPGFSGNPKEGIGLANTRARLSQLYGDVHRLELSNGGGDLTGAVVAVTLPYRRLRQPAGTRDSVVGAPA